MTDSGVVYYIDEEQMGDILLSGSIQSSLSQANIIFEGTQISEHFGHDVSIGGS